MALASGLIGKHAIFKKKKKSNNTAFNDFLIPTKENSK
jgi:hypothetical protein